MNYYYMDELNREIGPVSLENIKAVRLAGVIKDHTLIRPETGGPWSACFTVIGTVQDSSGAKLQAEATKAMSATLADAKSTLSFLNYNPVGGLAPAFQKLGTQRAGAVGVFFLIVYVLAGAYVINYWIGAASSLASMNYGAVNVSLNTGNWSKLALIAGASAAAWVIALAVVRMIFQKGGHLGGDCFIAGSVAMVWAAALLAGTFVGLKNFEVLAILGLLVICITVMQLFVGLTRISELSEARATIAVPLVIVVEAWLTKVIFIATYN